MSDTFKAVPDQSTAHFTLENSLIPDLSGDFSCLSGTFIYDADHLEKSSIEASIDVKTLDTGSETRDRELISEAVFNAKKFPRIKFISKKFSETGDGELEVVGDLTVKNVTREAVLNVLRPEGDSKTFSITASTVINREEFKLELGSILKIAEALVGDDIHFEMDIKLEKI